MKLIKILCFLCILGILGGTGCAARNAKTYLFGAQKSSPISSLAIVDIQLLYTGAYIRSTENELITPFTTASQIYLPPGSYIVKTNWLGVDRKKEYDNLTVMGPAYHELPITVQAGKKYILKRVGRNLEEEITIQETAQ